MADTIVTKKLSPTKLRKVVLGKDATISRKDAIPLLRESDLPDRQQVLSQVLMDESDDAPVRHLAAVTLYQLNLAESRGILLAGSQQIQDARVLEGVVTILIPPPPPPPPRIRIGRYPKLYPKRFGI